MISWDIPIPLHSVVAWEPRANQPPPVQQNPYSGAATIASAVIAQTSLREEIRLRFCSAIGSVRGIIANRKLTREQKLYPLAQ
ncbi:MAG: hypothetical protein ABLQ96_00505 [Candidatus Acidiferrum sp.]